MLQVGEPPPDPTRAIARPLRAHHGVPHELTGAHSVTVVPQASSSAPTSDVVTIAGRTRTWRVSPSSVPTPTQMSVPITHEAGGSDSESDDEGDTGVEFASRAGVAAEERLSKTPESSLAWEKLMQPPKGTVPEPNGMWASLDTRPGGHTHNPSPPESSAGTFRTLSLPQPVLNSQSVPQ